MSVVMQQQLSYTMRDMTDDDLDTIMAIEKVIYSHPWTRGNFSDSLKSGYCAKVLLERGSIIGYALMMMVLDEAHLLNLSIAKAYQGQGIGRLLLAQMIDVAQNASANNMFLEVRVSNQVAIALYEKMGFSEMSIRRQYYQTDYGREDAVLMGRAI